MAPLPLTFANAAGDYFYWTGLLAYLPVPMERGNEIDASQRGQYRLLVREPLDRVTGPPAERTSR